MERAQGIYGHRQAACGWNNLLFSKPGIRLEGKRFLELGKEDDLHPELDGLDGDLDPGLPSTEDVILKTEQVTKNIQELLRAAQEFKHDRYGGGLRLLLASGAGVVVVLILSLGPLLEHPLTHPISSTPLYSFVPCSEKIHLAVTEMASLFPKVQGPERSKSGEWKGLGVGQA